MNDTALRSTSLRDEHAVLDRIFTDLCERARQGDWHDCDEVWSGFAGRLEEHMRYEEERLFPDFAHTPDGPRLVAQLRDEHAEIRKQLEALGVDIQLHQIRADTVDRFVAALRQHAAVENAHFYPWIETRA